MIEAIVSRRPLVYLAVVVIANAVCDALRPFKAELNATPVRWQDVAAYFE